MSDNGYRCEDFEKLIYREKPSQIPVHVTRKSYTRMLAHCTTQGRGFESLWACKKNGARVLARMVKMNIWDRVTGQFAETAPVVTMYCSGCDEIPNTHGGDAVWADEIITLSM